MNENEIRVGITHGDINGIGYEVILKTLLDPRITELCTPIVYGSPKVAAYHRKALKIEAVNMNIINDTTQALHDRVNMINCVDDAIKVELGKDSDISGESSFLALDKAVDDLSVNKLDVIVTAPINKFALNQNHPDFLGHTDFLNQKFPNQGLMELLVGQNLKIASVAGYLPMYDVSDAITSENVLSKIRLLNNSLIDDFMITRPRIAVLGLNPHSGESGLCGNEEIEAIGPAIENAREEGTMAFGPFSADGFFASDEYKKYDAVLAMYYEQASIPFKIIEGLTGVAYTVGLSKVRTAPAHGVSYGKVGLNKADEQAMRNAIYLAKDIFFNRITSHKISKNPLQKYDITPSNHTQDLNVEDIKGIEKEVED